MVVKQTGHHPFHIAIHHHRCLVKRNGGNGRRCIGANARQFLQTRLGAGEHPAMVMGHHAGAFQKVAGPRVIPKPGPSGHNIGIRCGSQRMHCGPQRHEFGKIPTHRRHGGLLQHYLGHPNAIGIGPVTCLAQGRRHAPRHFAGVCIVPIQQLLMRGLGHFAGALKYFMVVS